VIVERGLLWAARG